MGKSPIYLLIMGLLFGGLYLFKVYERNFKPVGLREDIKKPDIYLDNSKLYIKEHSYERSMSQLRMAIEALQEIEVELDEKDRKLIDDSIDELQIVLLELQNFQINEDDIDHAFSRALNALTIAELRLTETLIAEHHTTDAKVALKYGMYHIKNAIRFTNGHKQQYEAHIYDEIDSLLESESSSDKELINRLEFMIAELDSLVYDKVQ